jgi:hypothetical protein
MSIREIVELARKIARECVNGFTRACHYLKSLNLPVEFACWALRGV